jgi:hypothetical protein
VRRSSEVVGVAIETDEEARRFSAGPAQDPRPVAGADVDDDFSERANPLEQSSTVYRALRFSLHDDHGPRNMPAGGRLSSPPPRQ